MPRLATTSHGGCCCCELQLQDHEVVSSRLGQHEEAQQHRRRGKALHALFPTELSRYEHETKAARFVHGMRPRKVKLEIVAASADWCWHTWSWAALASSTDDVETSLAALLPMQRHRAHFQSS